MPVHAHAHVFSHVQLFATLWTVALQAPLSMGFFQVRILEQVAISSSRGPSQLRDRTHVCFCVGRRILYHLHQLGKQKVNPCEAMGVLISFVVAIFSQCRHISKHQVIHLK